MVVQATCNNKNVKTIIMLSTQGSGIEPISFLPKDTSVFLIHGEEDETIPSDVSVLAYNMAHEPERIEVYDSKTGPELDEVSDEVYVEVKDWILKYLINRQEKEI